jgi:tRNA-dihydrouridine synthase A
MLDPKLVAKIAKSMQSAVKIPVTVKCRLGVDNNDSYEELVEFVKIVSEEGGVTKFIIHARKCLLKGLSTA